MATFYQFIAPASYSTTATGPRTNGPRGDRAWGRWAGRNHAHRYAAASPQISPISMPGRHHVLATSAGVSSDANDSHSLPSVSRAALCPAACGRRVLHRHRRRPFHHLQCHRQCQARRLLRRNGAFRRTRTISRSATREPSVIAPALQAAPSSTWCHAIESVIARSGSSRWTPTCQNDRCSR